MSQTTDRIMQLLWQGKRDEARTELKTAFERVAAKREKVRRQAEECDAEFNELKRLDTQSGTAVVTDGAGVAIEMISTLATGIANAVERRQAVIDAAKDVAKTHNGLVRTDQVAKLLHERGVHLGVADSRIGTSIGNILYRLREFTPVGSGVYQYKGEVLPLQQ